MSVQLAKAFHRAARSRRLGRPCVVAPAADGQGPHDMTASVQDLLRLHGDASTAVILLIMAACCLVPIGGIGTVLSFAMVALAWRWALSQETRNLPERLGKVRFSEKWTQRVLRGFAWLYWAASRWLRPRWAVLTHRRTRPWWAAWITLMAGLIFLPIPFGNVLPGISLILLSLGWMFRDGAALMASKLVGFAAMAFVFTFGHVVWETLARVNAWVVAL